MKNHTCVSLLACLKSLITVLEINNNINTRFYSTNASDSQKNIF
jgi:hypothetical protein